VREVDAVGTKINLRRDERTRKRTRRREIEGRRKVYSDEVEEGEQEQ